MTRLLILIVAFVVAIEPLRAEPAITLERGISTETWVSWPQEREWPELGERLLPYPEFRQYSPAKDFATIRRAGFDFVRLTVDPAPVLSPEQPLKVEILINEVKAAIRELQTADLKVIVDLHTVPGGKYRQTGTSTFTSSKVAIADYTQLAATIAGALAGEDPLRVAFEPFNEPLLDCAWVRPKTNRWPEILRGLHTRIRQAAPKLTLVLQGGCWGSAAGLTRIDPNVFNDDNIIWSFHSYEPFLLTHQGASWTDGVGAYVYGLDYPPRPRQREQVLADALRRIEGSKLADKVRADLSKNARQEIKNYFTPGWAAARIERPLAEVAAWAKRHQIPAHRILLGEFGVIRSDLGPPTSDKVRAEIIAATRKAAEVEGLWLGDLVVGRCLQPD